MLYKGEDCRILFLIRARRQHVATVGGETAEYFRHLPRSLALRKNNLRSSLTNRAVMIDLGEPKIFEGKMPQPLDCFVRTYFLFLHLLEQRSKIL